MASRAHLMLRGRPVRLCRLGHSSAPGRRGERVTADEAARLLRPLLDDPVERAALWREAAELCAGDPPRGDADLLARLVSALESGRLTLEQTTAKPQARSSGAEAARPSEPVERDEPELTWTRSETEWIEVVLTDERGEPVPGIAYKIITSDGCEHRGYTDSLGTARLTQIPGGDCRVTFARHGFR